MCVDLSKFKSTYPQGYKHKVNKPVVDEYSALSIPMKDVDLNNGVRIAKTVNPIGLVDIYDEKRKVITEMRKPNKMATFGEMRRIWDNVNKELYDKLVEIKYLHA
jgi:hypothetical protein